MVILLKITTEGLESIDKGVSSKIDAYLEQGYIVILMPKKSPTRKKGNRKPH